MKKNNLMKSLLIAIFIDVVLVLFGPVSLVYGLYALFTGTFVAGCGKMIVVGLTVTAYWGIIKYHAFRSWFNK